MIEKVTATLLALLPIALIVAASPWFRSRLRSPLSWRTRALIESRKSLGKHGDADTKAALRREIDDLAFRRLAGFGPPPTRRRQLIALNEAHPVAADWPVLKDWQSVIDTDGDKPQFSPAARRRYLVWTPAYYFCAGIAIAFYCLMSYYALPLPFVELSARERALGASLSLLFMLPWLVWVTMVPNPNHYRRLLAVFELNTPPTPAAIASGSEAAPAKPPLVLIDDAALPKENRRKRRAEA